MKTFTGKDLYNTTYTFSNTTNNSFHKDTDWSKILDNLIASNIKKTNPYLSKYEKDLDAAIFEHDLKGDLFAKASNFLANYGKTNNMPFQYGHAYYIGNTQIIFNLNSIEIDGTEYFYDNFKDIIFLKSLPKPTKKIIINIYGDANIKINL